jgi:hypothetical protein
MLRTDHSEIFNRCVDSTDSCRGAGRIRSYDSLFNDEPKAKANTRERGRLRLVVKQFMK